MENIVTYTKRHVDEIQNALLGVSYKRSDYDEVALIGNFLMREVKSVYLWISWLCLFASITGILRWIHIQPPKHKPHIPSDFATDDCNTEQEVVRRIQHEWVLRIAIKIFLVLSFAFLFLHMAFGWYYFLTPCVSRSVVKQLSRSDLQHSVQMPSTWATTRIHRHEAIYKQQSTRQITRRWRDQSTLKLEML